MKIVRCAFVSAAVLMTAGCTKLSQNSTLKNDGSATLKITSSALVSVLEQIGKQQPPSEAPKPLDRLSEATWVATLKKTGADVVKSATTEADGWRTVEVEVALKDYAAWSKKRSEATAAMVSAAAVNFDEPPLGGLAARFYKTDKPNVAKVSLGTPLAVQLAQAKSQLEKLAAIPEDQIEQLEEQLAQRRDEAHLDDFRLEARLTVPGKILQTKGCKADGDAAVVFKLSGADLGIDGIKTSFGLKDGVWATFEFDPKEFKIALEDEAKATEAKVESRPAAKPSEEEGGGRQDGDR
ncbi:MAG TPA: hypothetical protein VEI02_00300 [Planctomycetota bacterium]|nr:hypothetical protein [Planctomycetota bacterium]